MMLTQYRSGKLQRIKTGWKTVQLVRFGRSPISTSSHSTLPVGLPDVQHVGIVDLHVVGLRIQEVEEVFDSQRDFAVRGPPDGFEQVLHE